MSSEDIRPLRVTCAPGLAPFLAEELRDLGLEPDKVVKTAVIVPGTWEDACRLCLELRTAFTVLFPLATMPCDSPKTLYHQVRSLPWEEIIEPDGYLTVESKVDHPSIDNSMYPNLQVKDAICDHLNKLFGRRPDSGSDRRGVVVHLAWRGREMTLSLNVAGRKLADRGYRRMPHRAPLQETLAAGIIAATEWDGTVPLALPMCGSGTLAIEAALIALDRAPGLLRQTGFACERSIGFDHDAWAHERNAIRRRAARELSVPIVASDIDPAAIEAARRNAETAGIAHLLEFHVGDFAEVPLPAEPGVLIVNPEYGERLGDEERLGEDYARFGRWLKDHAGGWTAHVLSGNPGLTRHLGMKTSRRVPFFNGGIECRLLRYDVRASGPTPDPEGG